MNITVRHLAALAGYGRGQGYLELRWRAHRGMRSEHFAISDLDKAALRALTLAPQHDVYVGAAPRAHPPPTEGTERARARQSTKAGCCGSTATSPTATTSSTPSPPVPPSLSRRAAAAPTPTGR